MTNCSFEYSGDDVLLIKLDIPLKYVSLYGLTDNTLVNDCCDDTLINHNPI